MMVRVWEIRCDRCGTYDSDSYRQRGMNERTFKRGGWKIVKRRASDGGDKHYCPECAKHM